MRYECIDRLSHKEPRSNIACKVYCIRESMVIREQLWVFGESLFQKKLLHWLGGNGRHLSNTSPEIFNCMVFKELLQNRLNYKSAFHPNLFELSTDIIIDQTNWTDFTYNFPIGMSISKVLKLKNNYRTCSVSSHFRIWMSECVSVDALSIYSLYRF